MRWKFFHPLDISHLRSCTKKKLLNKIGKNNLKEKKNIYNLTKEIGIYEELS